jgi:hypothetical protein
MANKTLLNSVLEEVLDLADEIDRLTKNMAMTNEMAVIG